MQFSLFSFATVLAVTLAAGPLFSLSAQAQQTSEVTFEKGNFGTMINGSVTGGDYVDYILRAKEGQEMFAELTVDGTNGHGIVYFNILPPDSDGYAIYNSSMDGNSTVVKLTESGPWKIRVYQMGNDKDSGKTAGFNLDLSIQ